jgi:hypothetical protein
VAEAMADVEATYAQTLAPQLEPVWSTLCVQPGPDNGKLMGQRREGTVWPLVR